MVGGARRTSPPLLLSFLLRSFSPETQLTNADCRHVRFAVTLSPLKTSDLQHRNHPGLLIGHTQQCGPSQTHRHRDKTAPLPAPFNPPPRGHRVIRAVEAVAGQVAMGGVDCSGDERTIVPSLRTLFLLGFIGHDRNGKA